MNAQRTHRVRSLLIALVASSACGSDATGPAPLLLASISAGASATCGVTPDGKGYCWGNGQFGALGNGDTVNNQPTPVPVQGGLTFAHIDAGNAFACGLTTGGSIYCWGYNGFGQIGDGSTATHPDTFFVGADYIAVSASKFYGHTCGVKTGGAAYCWGANGQAQVGNGSQSLNHPTPDSVRGGLSFTTISAGAGGFHTCALTANGAPYCWGNNGSGALGDSTTTLRMVPTAVFGGLTFATISTGGAHTCGITTAGAAYCWGLNNLGQLGNNDTVRSIIPVPVSGGFTFATISAGGQHTCAVTTTHVGYCWGENDNGQVGDGTQGTQRWTPTLVAGNLSFESISAGDYLHTCGVTTSHAAYCWGAGGDGRLGDGKANSSNTPVLVVQ